ncbi:MAG: GntR family transcriptional regulator [Pseudomonadota bacterium]|jgi:DNA-binding GntR family transcriptional regulator|uniref:GntR family transcriptional regulator n=1 Tax=Burkholderiaceae TaxID=119060 RepID=UPI0014852652|nr:GntR family transcriptional regulator [Burkholderia sp. 4M9327F10]
MSFAPPSRAALGSTVADILRNAILDGSLKPGEPIYEKTLSEQLSMSRSPIREALITLENEGLVVGRLNKAVTVRKPSAEEIRQIYTIRAALEGIAARWAAEKATVQLIADLRANAEALNLHTIAIEDGGNLDAVVPGIAFHMAIAEVAASDELNLLLQNLCNKIQLVMRAGIATVTRRRAEEIHKEHLAIIDAIERRDVQLAESLASAHVRGALERIVYQSGKS